MFTTSEDILWHDIKLESIADLSVIKSTFIPLKVF